MFRSDICPRSYAFSLHFYEKCHTTSFTTCFYPIGSRVRRGAFEKARDKNYKQEPIAPKPKPPACARLTTTRPSAVTGNNPNPELCISWGKLPRNQRGLQAPKKHRGPKPVFAKRLRAADSCLQAAHAPFAGNTTAPRNATFREEHALFRIRCERFRRLSQSPLEPT